MPPNYDASSRVNPSSTAAMNRQGRRAEKLKAAIEASALFQKVTSMTAPMATPSPDRPRTSKNRVPGDSLTTIENLAVSLVFRVMGECRYDRSPQEYYDIASRLPALKQLHYRVNETLRQFLAPYGDEPPEFTRFAAGHDRIVFERYPTEISIETIRRALVLSGMRTPRRRRLGSELLMRTS